MGIYLFPIFEVKHFFLAYSAKSLNSEVDSPWIRSLLETFNKYSNRTIQVRIGLEILLE